MLTNDKVIFQFIGPLGIRVEVGQSLLWLVGLILLFASTSLTSGAIFLAMLLAAIFLHELGHGWACLVQGVPVRRIMLHGGGGFCEYARTPSARQSEFITAMGPLTNLALWAIVGLLQWALINRWFDTFGEGMLMVMYYLQMFGMMNLALFAFNMLPVQPLDGGKLLHLGLLRFLPAATAHRMTGWIGLVFSIAWIPAAIMVFVTFGWILFFFSSIIAHYRMARGQLA